jgi:acyl-CoA dehydrogenase
LDDLETFREQTRVWLEENCPASLRRPMQREKDAVWGGRNFRFDNEDQRLWLGRMAGRGWTVPTWPSEYGGGGLSPEEAKILKQELKRIAARPALLSFGIWMLGPALLKYGSEAQKKEYLPKIARGEIRWCQGYSEPNAGSDLASLQTRAEDKGDHFLVNGQKVWTSYADKSDWIFCLVRTDPKAPKHEGISFLLFDMASPGVSTKPIQLISGSSPFCETFFDDVKVPKENLVGELNKGWGIAKYLLTHEREMIGATGIERLPGSDLGSIAADLIGTTKGGLKNTLLRADIVRHEMDWAAFMLTLERARDEAKAGAGTGAVSSMLKYVGTELNKERLELMMAIEGLHGLLWEDAVDSELPVSRQWLRSKGNSIEGGTSEIQLDIIAKRVLGLPKGET